MCPEEDGGRTLTPDSGDTGPGLFSPCANAGECPLGWQCLFWSPGCGIMGRCEPACPPLDASLQLKCGCGGQTFSGCANQPWAFEGECGDSGCPPIPPNSDAGFFRPDGSDIGPMCGPPDQGFVDLGFPDMGFQDTGPSMDTGAFPDATAPISCNVSSECPQSWHCIHRTAGCGLGMCEPSCPNIDGNVDTRCSCTGQTIIDACMEQSWQHPGPCQQDASFPDI